MVRKKIDPELLAALENYGDIDIWSDLPAARVTLAKMSAELQSTLPAVEGVSQEERYIPGPANDPDVRIHVFRPSDLSGPLPGLLWIHGGGYILGSIDSDVHYLKKLAKNVGCVIVSVDYRLAPEHPFPAPLEDCYAALQWLAGHAGDLGVDAARIAIGGISAGGGLAAALALLARDRGEVALMFQLLICPMLDDRNHHPSTHMDLKGVGWDRGSNRRGWEAYLGKGTDPETLPPHAIPARAQNLEGLPPAYIPVGTLDLFLDECIDYAQRLMRAGVATELHVFPGAMHAFEFRVPKARVSKRAHYLNFDILKHAFDQ